MREIIKAIILLVGFVGYVANMYYLVADPKIRDHNGAHQFGVVIPPLGAVMGYVYALDNIDLIKAKIKTLEHPALSSKVIERVDP